MTPLKKILNEVLKRVTPPTTSLFQVITFLKEVNETLKKKKVNATAVLGGSYAKGVWIAGAHDVDIFVRFKKETQKKTTTKQEETISDALGKILQQWSPERVHGSRDYYRIKKDGYLYELVPVLSITKPSEAENVTDASPLHTTWALKHLKGLQGDVRLAKLFCKTARVYGAESYISGFSGHVIDILIIHYKGFIPLLKAISTWNIEKKTVIDHEKTHKGKALRHLNTSKTEGPLILVDPVDPTRNAAAALGTEALATVQSTARKFLKRPSTTFFDPTFHQPNMKQYYCVRGTTTEGKPDVVGARFKNAHCQLINALSDFGVTTAHWHWTIGEHAWFWYSLKTKNVKTIERKGPPVKLKEHATAFKKKHKNAKTKGGYLYAITTPRYKTPQEAVDAVQQSTGVKLTISS